MIYQDEKKDVPVGVAIAGLLGLVGAWLYFQAPTTFAAWAAELDRYAEAHLTILSILLFATTINGVWIYSVVSRSLGINRQGRRLEILTGENRRRKQTSPTSWLSLAVAAAGFVVCFILLRSFSFGSLPSFVPTSWARPILVFVSCDLSFALFVVASITERAGIFDRLFGHKRYQLREIPSPKNGLVLGSVEEI